MQVCHASLSSRVKPVSDSKSGNWTFNLKDTDSVLTNVYEACVEAGPSACPIYESTVDEVRARVNKVVDGVHLEPAVVFQGTNNSTFGTVDYSDIKTFMLEMLYQPYASALSFAKALVALEQGNADSLYDGSVYNSYAQLVYSCAESSTASNNSQPYVAGFNEIQTAIACGDQLTSGGRSIQELRQAYSELKAYSEEWASAWLPIFEGPCSCVSHLHPACAKFERSLADGQSGGRIVSTVCTKPPTPFLSAHSYRLFYPKHEPPDNAHREHGRPGDAYCRVRRTLYSLIISI